MFSKFFDQDFLSNPASKKHSISPKLKQESFIKEHSKSKSKKKSNFMIHPIWQNYSKEDKIKRMASQQFQKNIFSPDPKKKYLKDYQTKKRKRKNQSKNWKQNPTKNLNYPYIDKKDIKQKHLKNKFSLNKVKFQQIKSASSKKHFKQKSNNQKSDFPEDPKTKRNITKTENQIAKKFFKEAKNNNRTFLYKFFYGFQKIPKHIRNRFDFSIVDIEGSGVEHYSVWNNNTDLIYFLFQQKVDFNRQNKDGITPLMMASLKGYVHIVEILIRVCQVNNQDNDGNTALHYAVVKENLNVIKVLLSQNELDHQILNNNQQRPIDLAHPRICIQLQNYFLQIEKQRWNKYKQVKLNYVNAEQELEHLQDWKQKFEKNLENFLKSTQIESSQVIKINGKLDIQDFHIHCRIGKGSFGEVYLIQKKVENYFYAMKVLEKSMVFKKNLKKYALTERNVLSIINHPFIVNLRYALQNDDFLFLIMDYYPGGNLSELIHREKRIKENLAQIYTAQIILAIEELHKRDVIFRDLKPENIVFDSEGNIRLIDFGLSKEGVNATLKGARSFCGSMAYLAPEMVKKKDHGKVIDWFSLGIVLYEMLTGSPPFYGKTKEELFFNIQYQNLNFPSFFSEEVCDFLDQLLTKKPEKRLGSQYDAVEIKNHPWFYKFPWKDVYNKKLKLPKPQFKKFKVFDVIEPPSFLSKSENMNQVTGWTFIESSSINQD